MSTPIDSRILASPSWPILAFAITGIDVQSRIPWIISGWLILATPPSLRMSAGTLSRAITATAPESSAIAAWSGLTTSMMTPPCCIRANPRFSKSLPRLNFEKSISLAIIINLSKIIYFKIIGKSNT